MKKCVLGLLVIVLGILGVCSVKAVCTAPTPFIQMWDCVCGVKDTGPWINGQTMNFWCLTDSTGQNDEGTSFNWFQMYSPGVWCVNGDWGNGGVNGCCGMSAEGFDSMMMMLTFSQDFNPNSSNHSGEHVALVVPKDVTNGLFRMCGNPVCFETLPVPAFSGAATNDGKIAITLSGWASGGPASYYYYPIGSCDGPFPNWPIPDMCSPNRISPCPPPIYGYKIVARGATCNPSPCGPGDNPVPPATGIASDWNEGDEGCTIIGRTTLPSGVCIHDKPAEEYLFLATQLLYADQETSYYVSANSAEIEVGAPAGKVANNFSLSKSSSNLTFNWTAPGGTCTVLCYNIYQGTLPWNGYDHAPIACCVSSTNYSVPLPAGSHYYIVVPDNNTHEGSYGTDSFSNQIPQSASACHPQITTTCN